jgi:two-component system, NarL family, sensor kinase
MLADPEPDHLDMADLISGSDSAPDAPPIVSPPTVVRQALTRFIAGGLVTLVLVSAGVWYGANRAAESQAVQDAQQRTSTLASAVIQPEITQDLVNGSPAALARFDALVHERVLGGPVVRIKLWDSDGRIVYSDEPRLVGELFSLESEELEALDDTGGPVARSSELDNPENEFDAGHGPLLEVYLPVHLPSGRALLFETYQTRATLADRSWQVFTSFAPVALGGLAVMLLLLVPVAWSLARNLDHARAERESLLRHALDASTTERRRIAAHLHDGLVQSLTGSSYALTGVADKLGTDQQSWASNVVRDIAADVRQGVLALRSLLVEIYPPSLRRAGIAAALSDLTAQLSGRAIDVTLDVDDVGDLPESVETALFRVAQEAIRNIVKHAEASRVQVSLERVDDSVVLAVSDDGHGFVVVDPSRPSLVTPSGHFGLALLEDALAEVNGVLAVTSSPGHGTTLTARIPLP